MTTVDVAATIAPESLLEETTIDEMKKYESDIDIIELRIDQWANHHLQLLKQNLSILKQVDSGFKVLVTYRTKSQGGKGKMSSEDYLELLKNISTLDDFHMLDIEWDSDIPPQILRDIVRLAQQNFKQVIVSYHNFSETPGIDELRFTYYKMHQLGPNFIKIAVMPNSREDVAVLLEAMASSVDAVSCRIIGISMSELGLVSRIAQGVFGGTISYGCLGEPQAPGQIHVKALKEQLAFYENT
ncbi:type I 3-dehydroquinate dehydratase [Staphylococcus devriesei]|uniref:3-dehydroquinate dehydratase n=1 Tax=Staphylococcus devriesei TaxID=586733 RepID=A0A2K4DK02_9STAP|nr:type I 3-dehydroquinate dehydratase [Staphylococcus devriesei]MCE5089155.1 type I 3-dehydroquinate dehydratase [Staphylococcus devriesei]MCE5096591.1 type I 3-dehydroquinate dehydratase [Staphylococcus devriesei]PNZ87157.1 type I 3-dehydroquinate dehydratase [Staphylococcus devriesei]PTE72221.1 type I 3-dehydroquinate dehydratase [Staphylococcus devriesei]PTF11409.1 type I 3-dehydroquinate dehydratase [Staphylococcus devriesei]